MREIKFRAKCKLKGKWMYGSYRLSGGKHYINSTEIHRETLGQYTGFKDRNEVEIYEGDIVDMHYFFANAYAPDYGVFEDESNIIGMVGINSIGTYTETEDDEHYWLNYLQEPEEELEVLGNIHDNPNLYKEEYNFI